MSVEWTSEQKKVIDLRDRDILVSAAAGSGKTAVLVERIVNRICVDNPPVDIDRMLVVTLCLLSSLYIAFLSPSAMVRVCKAVTFLIVVLFLLTAALSVKNGDITNLHISSQDPGQEIKKGFLSAMPLCVPLVALLSVRLTKGEKLSGVSLYTPLKGAMLVLFTIPVIYVCGESAFYDKLPSYRLSAYSQSVLIERMNAPFILMCIMAAILFSAVFFGAAVTAVRGIYEKA